MNTISRTLALTLGAAVVALGLATHAQQGQQGQQQGQQGQQSQQGQQPPPKPGQDPANPQVPTFRGGVNFVRVDAIVTDKKGDPVNDLEPADFEVLEDGKPQKVETFKLVKLDDAAARTGEAAPRAIRTPFDEESEAARDDVRLFAIFLDDYHVRRDSSEIVRDPLSRFVQMRLSPKDMVGIMYPMTPLSDVSLTRDREATVSALQKFEGRKYDYRPRNSIEAQYAQYPTSTVERIRNQVTLSGLRALIKHLGGLREGRKAIILVSEGYTNLLPPQMRNPIADMSGAGNPLRNNPTIGENDPNEERAAWVANVDMQRDLRDVYDDANRQNVAIYALDPRGLAVNEFNIDESVGPTQDRALLQTTLDTLRTLADQTDGKAIINRNDFDGGLRQIVRDSSAYYLLGYNSSGSPSDGKFHEIKVRVKRSGVQVRYRKGYWALTADEKEKALAPAKPSLASPVQQALASIDPTRGRPIVSWLGMSRGENGKTKVTFVWEPVPTPAGVPRAVDPRRVSVVAGGASGEYFRGRVPDTATAAVPAVADPATGAGAPPAGSRVTFQADPGRMQMRVAIEGSRDELLDTEVRDVIVPDLTVPQLSISTPVVYRARNLRDFKVMSSDPAAIPTASRQFSRTERLLIRFDVYAPGTAVPTPTARLLNRGGTAMANVTVQADPGGAKSFSIDLPLAGMAVGEYVLEITSKSESGEAAQLLGMRITN